MKSEGLQSVNLLDLKPVRNIPWETKDKNTVILLVPKFQNRYLVKWLVPRLSTSMVAEQFGEPMETLLKRIGLFVQRLLRNKFLSADVNNSAETRTLSIPFKRD